MIYVQADLIGWNRASNNGLQHARRFFANKNIDLLNQYQQFFNSNGKNGEFLIARRSIRKRLISKK